MEAEQARGHVEQYKSIALAHEQALAELNTTYDEYKRSVEAGIAQKDVSAPATVDTSPRADQRCRRRFPLCRSASNL